MGVLLYDASRIEAAMKAPEKSLVDAHRSVLLDPNDPVVIREAQRCGVSPEMIDAAKRSPTWKWVMEWKLALPLHPEFRTMPMLYYVPPLLPVVGRMNGDIYEHDGDGLLRAISNARIPLGFLASLFTAGNVDVLSPVMLKLAAVRIFQRQKTLGDLDADRVRSVLRDADLTPEQAEAIYRLTALADPGERYVLPPLQREEAIATDQHPDAAEQQKGECGYLPNRTAGRTR
jgi:nitrate reductase beta subunit